MKLGVNIDHIATLREARYRGLAWGEPDLVEAAALCERAGAHGITIHLREDRRHIQDEDVRRLRQSVRTRLNLEMSNTPEIVDIALRTRPDIVCIVPERRKEVTTEGGLDAHGQVESLTATRRRLNAAGIEVSLFIDPDPAQVEASARIGAQFVELHTGAFAEAHRTDPSDGSELDRLVKAARLAHAAGLAVNAGHGLTVANVPRLFDVPHLVELNIGHHIVSRALAIGLPAAVTEMLNAMKLYAG